MAIRTSPLFLGFSHEFPPARYDIGESRTARIYHPVWSVILEPDLPDISLVFSPKELAQL